MRHAEYHALPALGGSTAARLGTQCIADALSPVEITDAMIIGSCVDAIWCESQMPSDVYEALPRRTSGAVADLAARGVYAVTPAMQDTITACVDALHSHRMATAIRESSVAQSQFVWAEQTEHGEIQCKGMIDLLALGVVWDLKTVGGAGAGNPVDPSRYRWSVRDRGTDLQLAHYIRGARANGHAVELGGIIACGTRATPQVEIFGMSENVIAAADHRLLTCVYPLWAKIQRGDQLYRGFGSLSENGLEPIHELDFDRRD